MNIKYGRKPKYAYQSFLKMLLHCSLILLTLSQFSTALCGSGPVVNTTSGSYVGVHDTQNEVDVFKGIRFASPPARFTPATPISNAPISPQSAVAFGNDCPQFLRPSFPASPNFAPDGVNLGPPVQGANQSEDCLFVNVWRPSNIPVDESLSILVYIYGGGFFSGSGSEWNGTSLVRRSVATKKPFIFITFNYRLGVLGFIGSAQAPPSALNLGLQDQRAALRWIQDNAEAFGGDGSRITISGESVGGSSVHMHYLYPDSRNTFRAGISSSGTSLVLNTPACEWYDRPGGAYNILGNLTGCGTGAGSFKCLQDLPFDTFWPLALITYQPPGGALPPWVTCKGPQGSFIDEYPVKKVLDGDFLNLPIITGTNLNEGNLLIGTTFLDLTPQPPLEIENSILSGFIAGQATNNKTVSNDTIAKLLDLYSAPTQTFNLTDSTLYNRAAQFETEYSFLAPQRLFLKTASAEQRKQDVWAYSFQQLIPGAPEALGVFHSSDLYYLDMGCSPVPHQKLLEQMQDFYISFVNDLNPGTSWPQHTEKSNIVMRLLDGRVGPIADTAREAQTDFLDQVDVMEQFGRFG
ncbi:Alpha/Beta hydrolase protein [Mycena maculata]|uniref:Alpha/Beta hydrolase protein n=1 Tax=Mycena maculata TaxID=230809 RepID=A0AAD7HJ32_9AGAR|nr:Alpha/Beta hydrolase protein [Mycena maculata]